MSRRWFLRRICGMAAGGVLAANSSCGTLLHPERVGQPRGRLDPGVVALDGVGLLVFFIPGAIAFAVDFYTGAIYLPPHCAVNDREAESAENELIVVHVDPKRLTRDRLERTLAECTGRPIDLTPGNYRVARLNKLTAFADTAQRLRNPDQLPGAVIFRCQSE